MDWYSIVTEMYTDGILIGVVVTSSLVIGLFFLKYWKQTGDLFFLLFACSFLIQGAHRLLQGTIMSWNEGEPYAYLIRLFAYGLIILAILGKNYKASP